MSIIFFLLKHITHLTFEIRGEVPQTPCLIASKHQSTFETFVFHKILKNPVYFLKKELLYIPIFGWYLKKEGMIPLSRHRKKLPFKNLCLRAAQALSSGSHIILFPEGTRTSPGAKVPYKTGISLFYQALNVPVVPVALNSGLFWGRRSFLKRPGCVIIEFLPPISPGLNPKSFLTCLETQLEERSKDLINDRYSS
ncbi:MAG: 1-acyl-sn-glycerol-3-phosphate acyltransferase [Proteobacteria bacterium]|nr:1-acyl-sn-glycerol-3-phosphate acyltransferase [Pseudomonadota bacterium]